MIFWGKKALGLVMNELANYKVKARLVLTGQKHTMFFDIIWRKNRQIFGWYS